MVSTRELVDNLARAVAIEQKFVEQGKPAKGDSLRAEVIEALSEGDGNFRYALRLATWPGTWQSTSVLIQLSDQDDWQQADLVSVSRKGDRAHEMVVQRPTALPPGVRVVQVRNDEATMLRNLTTRLHELRSPDSPDQLRLAGAVVNSNSRTRIGHDKQVAEQILATGTARWNAAQEQAIRQALGSELTFIWGPPGTGKTDVLAAVIEGCFRQGQRVLFVAPTRVAVDQALLRVCERLQTEPTFEQGLVQRVNGAELAELRDRFGAFIDPSAVEARLSLRLTTESSRLQQERTKLAGLAGKLRELEVVERSLSNLATRLNEARAGVAAIEQGCTGERHALATLDTKIEAALSASGLTAPVRRRGLPELRRKHELTTSRLSQFEEQLRNHLEQVSQHEIRVTQETHRRDRLRGDLGPDRPTAEGLRHASAVIDVELKKLDTERASIGKALRANVKVTATTVAAAVTRRLSRDGYDTVVIDEAGMVDLPSAFCATALARQRVVVAGDFRQLPAVVKTKQDTLSETDQQSFSTWYARDVFAASGMVSAGGTLTGDERLAALREQYRMRSGICDLVNVVAYPDAPLSTGRDDSSRTTPSALLSAPLILIDTSERVIARRGNSNPVHAAVIRELIRGLQYDAVLPARREPDADPGSTIGIIAPYRDQVRALQRELSERFGDTARSLVDTVHRFQGSQRPVIVLDTVAGGTNSLGWFYRGVGLTSDTCRLLNVALSRAQDHLVVVADAHAFSRLAPVGSEVQLMMDHLLRHAQVIPATELIPIRSAAELPGLSEDERDRPAFFPADEVFAAIAWDITHSRRQIDLFCPFLNGPATKRWLPPLREAVERGVRVALSTRPHSPEEPLAALIAQLQAAGVQIDHREAMHEKVMILDDVLWHGSLNLLAHTRSTDLMMRLVSTASAEDVRRIVTRAQPTRAAPSYQRQPSPSRRSPQKTRPANTSTRIYLEVPYEEKDQAKNLGARWDPAAKHWFIDPTRAEPDMFSRWLPEQQ